MCRACLETTAENEVKSRFNWKKGKSCPKGSLLANFLLLLPTCAPRERVCICEIKGEILKSVELQKDKYSDLARMKESGEKCGEFFLNLVPASRVRPSVGFWLSWGVFGVSSPTFDLMEVAAARSRSMPLERHFISTKLVPYPR